MSRAPSSKLSPSELSRKAVKYTRVNSSPVRKFFAALHGFANGSGNALVRHLSLHIVLYALATNEQCYAAYLEAFALPSRSGVAVLNHGILKPKRLAGELNSGVPVFGRSARLVQVRAEHTLRC